MTTKIKIAPSLLAANFARLQDEVELVTKAGADLLHVDVMDGHFVPNITIGPCVISAIKKVSSIPLDVHLMIDKPDLHLEAFAKAGSDFITFHIEALPNPHDFIERAHSLGVKVGVSIKPLTPVETIIDILARLDLVLIMSVEPGFGGQKFQPQVLSKIEQLKKFPHCPEVSIDGGINLQTAPAAVAAGATILAAGSAIFHASDPALVIRQMKDIAA